MSFITHWLFVTSKQKPKRKFDTQLLKSLWTGKNKSGCSPVQRKKISLHNSDDNSICWEDTYSYCDISWQLTTVLIKPDEEQIVLATSWAAGSVSIARNVHYNISFLCSIARTLVLKYNPIRQMHHLMTVEGQARIVRGRKILLSWA